VALAPGSIIVIAGDRLAENSDLAQSAPLPTELVNTEVIMADRKLPLYYVDQHQVNAIVPNALDVNTTHQVLIRRGLTYSRPVAVDVAPAQPGIFVSNGYAIIYATRDGAPPFLVSPATPAQAGDNLAIYCTGLGITDPTATDGALSASPARTKDLVTVTIDGQNAKVLTAVYPGDSEAFTGLPAVIPGLVGVYEVDVEMPPGITPGDHALVQVTVAGQTSPVAEIAVR
jgi:uncharacterized protein (TIGR03437 family)